MGMRLERVKDEMREFYQEVVVENGPRYKHPKEWGHLYVDFWVSLCGMSYTLGHVLALASIVVPLAMVV